MSIQESINRVLAQTTIGAGARAAFKKEEQAKIDRAEAREYQEARDLEKHQQRLEEIKAQGEQKIAEVKAKGEEERKTQGQKERAQTKRTKLKTEADIAVAQAKKAQTQSDNRRRVKMEQYKTSRAEMMLQRSQARQEAKNGKK